MDARHVHEDLLESWRGLLEDRCLRAVARRRRRDRLHPVVERGQPHPPVGTHGKTGHRDPVGVDLGTLAQIVDGCRARALVIVEGDADLADVRRALPRPVEMQAVEPAIDERVIERVNEGLLRHVHAGAEHHRRRLLGPRQHVQHTLDVVALEGNLDPFDRVGCVLHHLVEAFEQHAVQVDLLGIVVLEDRVLRLAVMLARDPVELGRGLRVAGLLGRLGNGNDMARVLVHHPVDLGVGLHLRRHHPVVIGEVLDTARGLDDPVQHPLLVVTAAFGLFRHFWSP